MRIDVKYHSLLYNIIGITVTIGLVFALYVLEWWEILALGFLKFGLGFKIAGIKSFSAAVIKIGGKKALAVSATGILMKRHVIDLLSKFFAEHSISRYKENVVKLTKIKIIELKTLPLIKKIKTLFSALLSIPIFYTIWSKVLTGTIQKLLYAFVYPILKALFALILTGLSFVSNTLSFLFQVLFLNILIEKMQKYKIGKILLKILFLIIAAFAEFLDWFNQLGKYFGFDIKHELIVMSLKINKYLEHLIYKKSNARNRLLGKREIHKTSREKLSLKRFLFRKAKERKPNTSAKIKKYIRITVNKNLTWQEKREKRKTKKLHNR